MCDNEVGNYCEKCSGADKCGHWNLFLKEAHFDYMLQGGLFQKMPLEQAAGHWITNRKNGIQSKLVRV